MLALTGELKKLSGLTPTFARRAMVAALGATLVGCAALLPATEAPELCGFPPGTELAFVGRSSLKQLPGLSHPDDVAEGQFYITAEDIPFAGDVPPMRRWCVITEEGHMTGGGVPVDWTPPAR